MLVIINTDSINRTNISNVKNFDNIIEFGIDSNQNTDNTSIAILSASIYYF